MNEILSTIREIEENPFSSTITGCSGSFWKISGIAINNNLCVKTKNITNKTKANLEKRRFPASSTGQEFFSKIRLGHVLSISNTYFCAKNQKNLMIRSRENAIRKGIFLKNRTRPCFGHC